MKSSENGRIASGHFKAKSEIRHLMKRFSGDIENTETAQGDFQQHFSDQLEIYETEINALNKEVHKFQNLYRVSKQKIKELTETIDQLNEQLNNANRVEDCAGENSPFFVDYSNNGSAHTSNRNSADYLKPSDHMKRSQNVREYFETDFIKMQGEFTQRMEQLQKQNEQLKIRLIEYQSISMIVEQYKVFEMAIEEKETKIKKLERQNRDIKRSIEIMEIEIDALKGQINLLNEEKQDLLLRNESLRNEINSLNRSNKTNSFRQIQDILQAKMEEPSIDIDELSPKQNIEQKSNNSLMSFQDQTSEYEDEYEEKQCEYSSMNEISEKEKRDEGEEQKQEKQKESKQSEKKSESQAILNFCEQKQLSEESEPPLFFVRKKQAVQSLQEKINGDPSELLNIFLNKCKICLF